MTVKIFRDRRVKCEATIALPLSARAAWGQLRDFRSSAMHDPFHARVMIAGDIPSAGAALEIEHRYMFWTTSRVGRILSWDETGGFAFSDLNKLDSRRAFPHTTSYRLTPIDPRSSQLLIRVGGLWTAPLPRWIGQLWLRWVFLQLVRNTENHLLRFSIAVRNRALHHSG